METNFPRGSAPQPSSTKTTTTTTSKKNHRKRSNKTDDDDNDILFTTTSTKKKKPTTPKQPTKSTTTDNLLSYTLLPGGIPLGGGGIIPPSVTGKKHQPTIIESLSFSVLTKGMTCFGIVRDVMDDYCTISLPGMLTGYSRRRDENEPPYTTLLSPHQYLPVRILNVTSSSSSSSTAHRSIGIECSIHPSDVNKGFTSQRELYAGTCILGKVTSREDHGYVVDVGRESLTAFCRETEADGRVEVGRVILFRIVTSSKSSGVLQLTPLTSGEDVVWKEGRDTLASLCPGRMVAVKVRGYAKNGVLVSFGDAFHGAIEVGHLGLDWGELVGEWRSVFSKRVKRVATINARIICVDTLSKILRLSLLPHILSLSLPPTSSLTKGTILSSTKVRHCDYKLGALVCPTDSSGVISLPYRNTTANNPHEFERSYQRNMTIPQIRIISTNKYLFENYLEGSTDEAILSASVLSYDDLVAGRTYDATVITIGNDFSYILFSLGKNVKAICPQKHIFDAGGDVSSYKRAHLTKLYKVGKSCSVRVLRVNPAESACTVTLQPSLLKDDAPVTSFDMLSSPSSEEGAGTTTTPRIVTGYISKVHTDKGLVISFYNNIYGFIHAKRIVREGISPPSYDAGRVLKCRVVRVVHRRNHDDSDDDDDEEEEEKRRSTLELSLNLHPAENDGDDTPVVTSATVLPKNSMKIAKEYSSDDFDASVTIKLKYVDGRKGKVSARIAITDFDSLDKPPAVGESLDVVGMVLTSHRKNPRVTILPSITSASPSLIPSSMNNLYAGATVRGIVNNITPKGAFLGFRDNLVGLLPNPPSTVTKGRAVTCQVSFIDKTNKKLGLDFLKELKEGEENLAGRVIDVTERHVAVKLSKVSHPDKRRGHTIMARIHLSLACEPLCQPANGASKKLPSGLKFPHPFCFFKKDEILSDLTCVTINSNPNKKTTYCELTQLPADQRPAAPILKEKEEATGRVMGHLPNGSLQIAITPDIRGVIPPLEVSTDPNVLSRLKKHYPVGQTVTGRIVSHRSSSKKGMTHVELSLLPLDDNPTAKGSQLAPGTVVWAVVNRRADVYHPPALMLELRGGVMVRCCVTELNDVGDWINMPLGRMGMEGEEEKKKMESQETSQSRGGLKDEKDEVMKDAESDDDDDGDEEEEEEEEEDVSQGFYPHGTIHQVTILQKSSRTNLYSYDVSLRPSRISSSSSNNNISDDPLPQPKDVISAYVTSTNAKGCFVRYSRFGEGKIFLKDLSDQFVKCPEKEFPMGRLVRTRVTSVVGDDGKKTKGGNNKTTTRQQQRLLLNARDSIVHASYKYSWDDITPESKHDGIITKIESYGVFIKLDDSNVMGLAHISECGEGFIKKGLDKMYDLGDLVRAYVLSVDKEKKRVGLSLKRKWFEEEEEDSSVGSSDEEEEDEMEGVELENAEDDDLDSDDDNYASKLAEKMAKTRGKSKDDDDSSDDGSGSSSSSDSDSDSDDSDADSTSSSSHSETQKSQPKNKSSSHTPLDASIDFDWSSNPQNNNNPTKPTSDSDSDSHSDSESSTNNPTSSSHATRKKQRQKSLTAQSLLQRETALADGTADANPTTPSDFERLIASQPNFSEHYIKFMAYYLSLADIDAARRVGERALEKISFREEEEKLNVWTALLALELKYGEEQQREGGGGGGWKAVMERACHVNNPKQIYLRVGEMLEKELSSSSETNSHWRQITDNHYLATTRKFKTKKKAWLARLRYLLKQSNRHDEAHDVLKQSMTSLPKHKRIPTVCQFGQWEYEWGCPERGRTIFENLIVSYPKRLDLLFVYVDKEVKLKTSRRRREGDEGSGGGVMEEARRVFRRVVENEGGRYKYGDKKMKNLFKKWYRMEDEHGDDDAREEVKEAAKRFVERTSSSGD